ncbi:MAG: hypothetical protein L3J28_04625 [Candidatus Polarisedimenticolaceae bacterium]|nr:hypothetical protein [Candidatus Polarisedimenticolaceae bacterium]
MANSRKPGPIGTAISLSKIDNSTLCLAPSFSSSPLIESRCTPSQPIATGEARLIALTRHIANLVLHDSSLHSQYTEACRRAIEIRSARFQQTPYSEGESERLNQQLCQDISSTLGLIGSGDSLAFYQLLSTIRAYTEQAKELLNPKFSRLSSEGKGTICSALFHSLSPSDQVLNGATGIEQNRSWLLFLTSCIVWMSDSETMAGALTWQPEITKVKPYRPIGQKPTNTAPPAPRSRPSAPAKEAAPEEEASIDQNQQAKALESAAKDGTPFCEECEKARKEQQSAEK